MTPDGEESSVGRSGLNRLMATLPYTSLVGVLGVFVVALLGFEEPHPGMFAIAAVLLLTAPVGMVVHLVSTTELSPEEKRLWWMTVLSGNLWLLNSYFRPETRRGATARLYRSNLRRDTKE